MHKIFEVLYSRFAFRSFSAAHYDKAEYWFEKIAAESSEVPGLRHNLGLVKIALGKYGEAQKLLERDLERYGESYPRLRSLADAHFLAGNGSEAGSFYRKALDTGDSGGDETLIRKRMAICSDEERYAAALRAMSVFQEGADALGDGNYDQAERLFRESIELDPSQYMARNNLGLILLNQRNNPGDAARQFASALEDIRLPFIEKNLASAEKAIREQSEKE